MRYKEFLIKISAFLMLFLICLIIYGKLVITHRPYETTVKEFYDESNSKSIDILFLGTSHCFASFNPKIIDNILNVNSYNLGISSQYLFSTEYLLYEALKYDEPQLVVIEIYNKFLNKNDSIKEMRKQYNSIDYTKFSYRKLSHILLNFPKELYLEAIFPGIREHDRWKNLDIRDINKIGKYDSKEGQYCKGFMGYYEKLSGNFENYEQYAYKNKSSKWVIEEDTKTILRNMIEKLRNENIQVLFVTSPYIGTFNVEDYGTISSEINDFFQEENVQYIDLNYHYDELNLNSEDFKDDSHLNLSGARKVSEYLAKYIESEYTLNKIIDKEPMEENDDERNYNYSNVILNNQYQMSDKMKVDSIEIKKYGPIHYTLSIRFAYDGDITELEQYNMYFRGVPSKNQFDKLSDERKKYGYEYWDFEIKPTNNDDEYLITTNFKTKIQKFDKFSYQLYIPKNNKDTKDIKIGKLLTVRNVVLK